MQSVFKINRRDNLYDLENQIEKLKYNNKKLEKENYNYKEYIDEFENTKLQMACIDILNKTLTFILICYILTTTSHEFTKVFTYGFSFFDWLCLFLVIIAYTSKFPKLIYWFDEKRLFNTKIQKKLY